MCTKFERMVALRYLKARKGEGFISVIVTFSVLGIMLGVAALIVVMAVMKGFRIELMDRVLGINSHISVVSYQVPIADYLPLSEQLRKIPGVGLVLPSIDGQALAAANNVHAGAEVRALTPEDIALQPRVAASIKAGNIADFGGDNILIGSRMAQKMNLRPGDSLQLISPQTTETILGAMPRVKDFTVAGIFEVGMFEYDSATIFMPLETAQLYFRLPEAVNTIKMYVKDREQVKALHEPIMEAAHHRYFLVDWKEANGDFVRSLDVERSAMFLILALIMCVAGFMILSGMWMLVVSKRREIAILRTMGASRMAIQRIFLMCGFVIGAAGTLSGFLLGVGFATHIQEIRVWLETTFDTSLFPAAVYFLTNIPASVESEDVVRVVGLAMGICLVATVLPARKAARMDPAEGLRHD